MTAGAKGVGDMLVFAFDAEFTPETKEELRKRLETYLGEPCLILEYCTAVIRVPDRPGQLKETCESEQ